MSYSTTEAGLLTLIRAMTGFSSTNATAGDYRILGKGVTKAVVLSPGGFTRGIAQTPRRIRQSWVINIEIYLPWTDEISTISAAVRTVRQNIMDQIDKYPTFNSTSGVINAFIASGGEPDLYRGENRRWWVQTLRCEVEERSTVTIAE